MNDRRQDTAWRIEALITRLSASSARNSVEPNRRTCRFLPSGGFGTIADFARISSNLSELRNLADYDPSRTFTPDEARVAISEARQAIMWFRRGSKEQQESFLTALLFKPR